MRMPRRPLAHPAGDVSAEGEQNGRAQQQPGNHPHESGLRSPQQQLGAGQSTHEADGDERQNLLPVAAVFQFAPVSAGGSYRARPQRNRVGGVGVHRQDAGEQQRGKGDESAAPGHRIQRAGANGSDK